MKKIYLLLLVCVLSISCSKDDDSANFQASINPPQWIHGTWKAESAGTKSFTDLEFTSNDMILLGLYDMSYKDNIRSIIKSGGEVTVEEDTSQDTYEITIDYSVGASIDYSFTKVDENTINWNSDTYGALPLQKQ